MLHKKSTTPPPPKIVFQQSKNTQNIPSLGNTLIQGVAFGTGSSIAKNAVHNIFKNDTLIVDNYNKDTKTKCQILFEELKVCLDAKSNICDTLFEKYSKLCLENQNI